MIAKRTAILSLQNGVDNTDRLARLWGQEKVLAGVVYLGSQVSSPGVIKHSAGGRIIFGQLDGKVTPLTQSVEQTLKSAAIPCEISHDIRHTQWQKLLWNAPFCAISCLTRTTVKDIVESGPLTQLAVDCMEEVRDAALTQGLALEPTLIEETLKFSRTLGDFKPSMLQDLEARKPLEFRAFNGVVVDLLRQAGKKVLINQTFHAALQVLDEKIRAEKF
jgi:2-dehydropantoate 2-reductase